MTTSSTIFGSVPVTEQAHSVASYQALLHTLREFDDEQAKGDSLLPGWTRAHVLAHLARNAESHARMLAGAAKGARVPQYAGGAASRRAEIDKSAQQSSEALVADVRTQSEHLFSTWESFPADLWDTEVETLRSRVTARETVWLRWFELEVHHVDLSLGFGTAQWPAAFVTTALARVIEGIGHRVGTEAGVGDWVVAAADLGRGWRISAAPDEDDASSTTRNLAVTVAADVDDEPAPRVTGPGHVVLAWLLGRVDASDDRLQMDDLDGASASVLPGWFPYP